MALKCRTNVLPSSLHPNVDFPLSLIAVLVGWKSDVSRVVEGRNGGLCIWSAGHRIPIRCNTVLTGGSKISDFKADCLMYITNLNPVYPSQNNFQQTYAYSFLGAVELSSKSTWICVGRNMKNYNTAFCICSLYRIFWWCGTQGVGWCSRAVLHNFP